MNFGFGDSLGLMESFEKPASFVLANLLWLMLAVPVIAIGAATAGLFVVFTSWVRGKHAELFSSMLGGMRDYWRKATVLFALDVAVGALVIFNLSILVWMEFSILSLLSSSVTLGLALITMLVNLYVWPLLVIFDLPLRRLLSTALRLAIGHLFRSFGLLVLALLPLMVGAFLPIVLLIASISASALVISWGSWKIIRRYIPEEDLATLESAQAGRS